MPTDCERFWEHDHFVVVGDSEKKDFPLLTYQGLKRLGKQVVPIDLGGREIDGDKAVWRVEDLPPSIEAAVLELPKEKTAEVVAKMAANGIRDIWIHQGTDTPEAMEIARSNGLKVFHGNCAVMYVNCTSYHKIHRRIWQVLGKF